MARSGIGTRAMQMAQTLMRTLVYETRRSKRVVIDPSIREVTGNPIFLIGCHRSGTTLVRLIVDSHSRIACPPESEFLSTLQLLTVSNRGLEGLAAMGFERDQLLGKVREFSSYFFETYAASHNKPRWADKTPSYVECLDFLNALYGDAARYVMIYRHGLDCASSIAVSGIDEAESTINEYAEPHEGAAVYWVNQCKQMRAFRAAHPDQCMELFYEKLVADPESETRRLFAFLGEEWEPQVLAFHEQPHDSWGGLEDRKAVSSKGFQPNLGRHREQPREILDKMLRHAAPMLEELGYEVDSEASDG